MKKYLTEEIYPKSQTGKCMVYFNMSHHYRRIYSAKPRINTNLNKRPQSQQCCSSPDVYNFVKRNCIKQPLLMTPRHKICIQDRGSELFKPKILESQAESKLKSLPVYQAPQKILTTKAVLTESNETPLAVKDDDDDDDDNDHNGENSEVEDIETKNEPIQSEKDKIKAKKNQKDSENTSENAKFSRPLDKSSVLFLKDITDDILRKGIYSNQSLEKLFTHHISKNKYSLSKDIMQMEVSRLKTELGMPAETEKQESEETIKDEEALTALDSLFLPSDIRDKVASSLGLARKSSLPLPSPKDSFTGSLELTSMSGRQDKQKENINDNDLKRKDTVSDQTSDSKENTKHDTVEEISSNKNSVELDVISREVDHDKTISDKLIDESVNRTKTINPAEENIKEDNSEHNEDMETISDLSSIHTESEN